MDRLPLKERFAQAGLSEGSRTRPPSAEGTGMDRLPLEERFAQSLSSKTGGIGNALPLIDGNAAELFRMVSLLTGTNHYECAFQRTVEHVLALHNRTYPEGLRYPGFITYQVSPNMAQNKRYGGLLRELCGIIAMFYYKSEPNASEFKPPLTEKRALDFYRQLAIAPFIAIDDIRQVRSEPVQAAIQQAWDAYQAEYRKEDN